MVIYQNLAAFGVGQLVNGALSTVGLGGSGEAVVAFLAARFADHSGKLTAALEVANDRAWKAFEIALAGDSFWDRCKVVLSSGDDKAFRGQVRSFLDAHAFSADAERSVCLQELRGARKIKLLAGGGLDPKALAQQAGAFAGFADPQSGIPRKQSSLHRFQAVAGWRQQIGEANSVHPLSHSAP